MNTETVKSPADAAPEDNKVENGSNNDAKKVVEKKLSGFGAHSEPGMKVIKVENGGKDEMVEMTEYEDYIDMKITLQGKKIFSQQSEFQKVEIIQNKWWGMSLYLDNVHNVNERDEFVYHEMIVHVPMMIHPNPKRVLIIGGGDGGSAREVLRYKDLEKAVMIDIDGVVVNACKEHMPSLNNGAFDSDRLELIIGDGIDYVKKAPDNSFDVVIVDSTDPNPGTVGEVLFTPEFYQNVDRILGKDGVVSTQSMMPMRWRKEEYANSLRNLKTVFKDNTWVYLIPTDAYNGQTSLGLCFKGDAHPDKMPKERVQKFCEANKDLKYYNYKIHQGALALPNYLKDYMAAV